MVQIQNVGVCANLGIGWSDLLGKTTTRRFHEPCERDHEHFLVSDRWAYGVIVEPRDRRHGFWARYDKTRVADKQTEEADLSYAAASQGKTP